MPPERVEVRPRQESHKSALLHGGHLADAAGLHHPRRPREALVRTHGRDVHAHHVLRALSVRGCSQRACCDGNGTAKLHEAGTNCRSPRLSIDGVTAGEHSLVIGGRELGHVGQGVFPLRR